MEILIGILITLIVFLVIYRMIPVKGITPITVEQAKAKLHDPNVQFVDVRTPAEHKLHHYPNFINIPLSVIIKRWNELDKDKEVIVICQSGMRSARAAKFLQDQGFQKVYNLRGGMMKWK